VLIKEKIKSPFKDKAGINLYDGDKLIVGEETYRLHFGGKTSDDYKWRLLGTENKSAWLTAKENCDKGEKVGNFIDEIEEVVNEGMYCEQCVFLRGTDHGVVYCDFLREGGLENEKDSYNKALEHYGSAERVEEATPHFLLFDGVKECGINLKF
jgi:hypothetical protein